MSLLLQDGGTVPCVTGDMSLLPWDDRTVGVGHAPDGTSWRHVPGPVGWWTWDLSLMAGVTGDTSLLLQEGGTVVWDVNGDTSLLL